MPQTTLERAARWPGGEKEATKCLRDGGWMLGFDWAWRHWDRRQPTERERDAAQYLIEEWDYNGLVISEAGK